MGEEMQNQKLANQSMRQKRISLQFSLKKFMLNSEPLFDLLALMLFFPLDISHNVKFSRRKPMLKV